MQFPWYSPMLNTKVLDRGRVVVSRRQKEAAHGGPRRPPGGIQRDGRASMDGSRTAGMYRRLGGVGIGQNRHLE